MAEPGDYCTADGCHEPAVGDVLYGVTSDGTEIVETVCYTHLHEVAEGV